MKQLDMGWYEKANCKGMDAKIFFPDIPVGCNHKNVFDEALKICGLCPVRKPCLALAMEAETNDIRRYGVFGGKTPRQRDIIGDKKSSPALPQEGETVGARLLGL